MNSDSIKEGINICLLLKKLFKCITAVLLFIFLPVLIIQRIIKVLFLKCKKMIYKRYFEICRLWVKLCGFIIKVFDFIYGINSQGLCIKTSRRIDKRIIKLDLYGWSRGLFIGLIMLIPMMPETLIKGAVSRTPIFSYIIMLIFLYGLTSWARFLESLSINAWVATAVTLITLTLFLPTWLIFLFALLRSIDFGLAFIAVLFCFLPSYHLTMTMLSIINNRMIRILIGTLFAIVVGSYTLMVFGTYDIKIDDSIKKYENYNFIEYSSAAFSRGIKLFSR